MRMRRKGFTLIELMIVVAIIGILAAVAVPKFADLLCKSREGAVKGTLGSVRSALSIYSADNEGFYPTGPHDATSTVLADNLVPKYLNEFPTISVTPYHDATSNVFMHTDLTAGHEHDGSGFLYDGELPADGHWGTIWVACTHTDSKSSVWTSY